MDTEKVADSRILAIWVLSHAEAETILAVWRSDKRTVACDALVERARLMESGVVYAALRSSGW